MNDPLRPVHDQITEVVFEPILNHFLDSLQKDDWNVEITHHDTDYIIVLGKPGQPSNTVMGKSAKEALDDLFRNLTQLGELPKEMREMQHLIEQQVRPIRDAISAQLEEDLQSLGI